MIYVFENFEYYTSCIYYFIITTYLKVETPIQVKFLLHCDKGRFHLHIPRLVGSLFNFYFHLAVLKNSTCKLLYWKEKVQQYFKMLTQLKLCILERIIIWERNPKGLHETHQDVAEFHDPGKKGKFEVPLEYLRVK